MQSRQDKTREGYTTEEDTNTKDSVDRKAAASSDEEEGGAEDDYASTMPTKSRTSLLLGGGVLLAVGLFVAIKVTRSWASTRGKRRRP
jgi:hypothetical protein